MAEPGIGPYEHLSAVCANYDPRSAEVARLVAEMINMRFPRAIVEHVGSTSVPGCAGKGVVDLMVLYPPGQLEAIKDVLDTLGFQRQTSRDPFPEDRPMRTGSLDYDGKRFLLHAHVIAMDSPEVAEFRTFRDELRANPHLVAAYVARKREIIAFGITDTVEYAEVKGAFVSHALSHKGVTGERPR